MFLAIRLCSTKSIAGAKLLFVSILWTREPDVFFQIIFYIIYRELFLAKRMSNQIDSRSDDPWVNYL